jgi:hypothetical protein
MDEIATYCLRSVRNDKIVVSIEYVVCSPIEEIRNTNLFTKD